MEHGCFVALLELLGKVLLLLDISQHLSDFVGGLEVQGLVHHVPNVALVVVLEDPACQ